MTTIPVLTKEFKISFDVGFESDGKEWWESVIHLTTGADNMRLPAVFIGSNSKCLIMFQNLHFHCTHALVPYINNSEQWIHLEIAQQFINHKAGRKIKMFNNNSPF